MRGKENVENGQTPFSRNVSYNNLGVNRVVSRTEGSRSLEWMLAFFSNMKECFGFSDNVMKYLSYDDD